MNGCTVIGAGVVSVVGGTYYISGEIKSSYNTSIYHLYKASLTSLKADGLKICSVKNTKRDADIDYNKEGLATLGVRVGLIGDEHKSRQLLVQIERYI